MTTPTASYVAGSYEPHRPQAQAHSHAHKQGAGAGGQGRRNPDGAWQSMDGKAPTCIANGKADLATERQVRATETSERNRVALRESERVAALQLTHATTQQEIVDAFATRLKTVQDGRTADAADAQRVRRQLTAFAARDREAARSNPTACERVADRAAVLADVAAEGAELLTEGRRLVEGRDAEVTLLRGLVRNDRALLAPARVDLPARL